MRTSAEKALERTNAERRELGLPPLERVTTERQRRDCAGKVCEDCAADEALGVVLGGEESGDA